MIGAGEGVRVVRHPAEGGVDFSLREAVPDVIGLATSFLHQVNPYELRPCVEEPACLDEAAVAIVLFAVNIALKNRHILVGKVGEAVRLLDYIRGVACSQIRIVDKDHIACLGLQGASGEVVEHIGVAAVAVQYEYLFEAVAVDLLADLLEDLMDESLGEYDSAGVLACARLLAEVEGRKYNDRLALCREDGVMASVHYITAERHMDSV